MVITLGNNIINAYTGGVPVQSIFANGVQVWPSSTPPSPTTYYVRWTPSYISEGTFSIGGNVYNYSDYSDGYFSFSTGVITSSAFAPNYVFSGVSLFVERIEQDAFANCHNMREVNISGCSYIGKHAFAWDSKLNSLYAQSCTYIDDGAFARAFSGISNNSADLPDCRYIGEEAFYSCRCLVIVSIPVCSYIGEGAFWGCLISQIDLPSCEYLGPECFGDNPLSVVNLPVCSYIGESAFRACSHLNTMILGSTSVCVLDGSSVFYETLLDTGSIYVPTSLVSLYKVASNWSYYSSNIYPIE